ncbi:putative RNA-directed DNA polymerase [Tanacetum coccineum]
MIMAQTNQVVHAKVIHRTDRKSIYCTFIYASNDSKERRLLWADLGLYKLVVCGLPWVLLGDFNVALNMEDVCTGSSIMSSVMCDFKDCVNNIEVVDINSTGIHFTWNQKPKGRDGILKKLDRIMGNMDFIDSFQGANFLDMVATHWNTSVDGYSMFQVVQKMKNLKKPIRKLMHDQGNLHDRVTRLRSELDEIQKAIDRDPSNNSLRDEGAVYINAFNEAKIEEESFLRQKAKIEWLEVGDSNSAYFHKTIKSRNQRSRIDVVRTMDNVEVTGTSVPEVTNDEKQVMFDIGDDNAPGPDVYSSAFFKKGWDVLRTDVCTAIQDFFSNGKLLQEINHTFFALIPKVTTPMKVNDYRPISCCNVLYKCISKIITNRIIEGIKEVVSDNQSAFIPGRRISDNILITQELMHNYHRNRGPPRCAFKVDIQKAYDTMDWRFLGFILKRFGFHQTMVRWIMACVTSASYSICINGNVHGYFKGKRGLRQGDPLSPYLFTLVMEILTLILKISRDFVPWYVNSAKVIIDSLDVFKRVSRLIPSISKRTDFFCNVLNQIKLAILNIIPFAEGKLLVKHLGVPLISSLLLNRDCKVLGEKARNRIGDWKNKSLSFAGRLQLCKFVISSMQVYWALVLVIPMGIVEDIQQLICGFIWCNSDLKRGKAKVAWNVICLPKSEGGLGLRSLEVFKLALMTTYIWNIISNKESLWVRWIHTYKLRGRTLWDVQPKGNMSWGWRKLLQLREFVRPYFWSSIGNGLKTSIWYDMWCLISPLSRFLTPRDITREGFSITSCVADLVSNGGWNWPQAWLLKAPNLVTIPAPNLVNARNDTMKWCDTNGNVMDFSVKCAWEVLRPRGNEVTWFHTVWFSQAIPRHAFHLWLIMRRSLKTQDKLRHWDIDPYTDLTRLRCSLCGTQQDSHEHLFFECNYSSKVWCSVCDLVGMDNVQPVLDDIINWFQPLTKKHTIQSIVGKILFAASNYYIWSERNNRLFKNTRRSPKELRDQIVVTVRLKMVLIRFKKKARVIKFLTPWKMPTFFRLYGD